MLLRLEAFAGQRKLGCFRFDSRTQRTVRVGSLPSADVCIPDTARVRAVVTLAGGNASLVDLKGGASVNGKPVGRTLLADGDEIRLSGTLLKVYIESIHGHPLDDPPLPALSAEATPPPVQQLASPSSTPAPSRPPLPHRGPSPKFDGGAAALPPVLPPSRERLAEPAVAEAAHPGLLPEPLATLGANRLEMRVYWGEVLLDVQHYARPRAITIGESKEADIFLATEDLPSDTFPLIRTVDDVYLLTFTSRMHGEVEMDGCVYTLDELRTHRAEPDPLLHDAYVLALPLDARAVVHWGGQTFAMRFVAPPLALAAAPLISRDDLSLVNLVVASGFVHLLLVVALVSIPYDIRDIENESFNAVVLRLERPPRRLDLIAPKAATGNANGQAKVDRAPAASQGREKRTADKRRNRPPRIRNASAMGAGIATRMFGDDGLLSNGAPTLVADLGAHIGMVRAPGKTVAAPRIPLLSDSAPAPTTRNRLAIPRMLTGALTKGRDLAKRKILAPKTSVDPDLAKVEMRAQIDRYAVWKVIHNHRGQVRFCYEQALQVNNNLGGRMTVRFLIGPDGAVVRAEVDESSVHDSDLEACILDRVRSWQFPPLDGGGTAEVRYPFVLNAS